MGGLERVRVEKVDHGVRGLGVPSQNAGRDWKGLGRWLLGLAGAVYGGGMIRRVFMLGFAIFVVLPGLWLTVENLRGRRMLAAAIRGLEARGETLDFRRLLPPPVPASSNGMERLVAAGEGLEALADLQPMAFEMMGPGRAVPGTRVDWWPWRKGSNRWETFRAAVAQNGPQLEMLDQAIALPYRRADLNLTEGFAKMQIRHLAPMKRAASVLAAMASNAAREGDMDGAIADLEGLRVLEADLGDEPILISQLVRMALVAIGNSRYWSILHARDWDEEQLARLQRVRFGMGLVASTVRSLEGERAGGVYEMRHGSSQQFADQLTGDAMAMAFGGGPAPLTVPGTMDEAVEFAGTFTERLGKGFLAKVVVPVWRFGWGDQAAAHYLQCLDRLLEANRSGIREQSYGPVAEFDLLSHLELSGYARLRTFFARLSLATLERASSRAYRGEMESRLNETGVALRRYRLRHGQWPDRLEQLVPEFLSAVPIDLMDGKPVRYRKEAEDGFTLWSVGENRVDDGGDGRPKEDGQKAVLRQWWMGKDAVWPLPAGPEQIAEWLREQGEEIEAENRKKRGKAAAGGRFTMSPELMKRYGLLPKGPEAATNGPTSAVPKPGP